MQICYRIKQNVLKSLFWRRSLLGLFSCWSGDPLTKSRISRLLGIEPTDEGLPLWLSSPPVFRLDFAEASLRHFSKQRGILTSWLTYYRLVKNVNFGTRILSSSNTDIVVWKLLRTYPCRENYSHKRNSYY